MAVSFILGLLLINPLPAWAAGKLITCYGYGGLAYPGNTRCPGSNACCGVDDTCLSNRLCHKKNDGPSKFVRGPCAVDPYDSGTCAQICLYNETKGVLPRVTPCSDGSLCCDDDEGCCDKGNGIFLNNDGQIADSAPKTTYSYGPERTAATFRTKTETSTPTRISPLTSSTPSFWTTTHATTSLAAAATDSDGNSKSHGLGLAIGLGVGLSVASLVIGLLALIVWWKKRSAEKQAATELSHSSPTFDPPSTSKLKGEMYYASSYELSDSRPPVELDGSYASYKR